MGKGLIYKCKKCGKEYFVSYGIGYAFHMDYEEIENDIKAGKQGEEWKAIFENEKYIAEPYDPLKFFIYIFMLSIYLMIWFLKALFWIPLILLGLIFDDGGPGPGCWQMKNYRNK